jgi:hypothetical protein
MAEQSPRSIPQAGNSEKHDGVKQAPRIVCSTQTHIFGASQLAYIFSQPSPHHAFPGLPACSVISTAPWPL